MTKTLTLQLPNERKGKKIREKNLRDQTVQPTNQKVTFYLLIQSSRPLLDSSQKSPSALPLIDNPLKQFLLPPIPSPSLFLYIYISLSLSSFFFISFRKKLGQEPWQELELERENGVARKSTNAKRTSVRVQETVCEARVAAEQYVPVHCPSFRPSSQSFTWLFLPVRGHNERFLARTPLFPHRDAPRFVPMPGPSAHLHGQVSGNLFPPRYSLLPSSSSPLTYHHRIFVVESDFFLRCLTVFDGVWRCLTTVRSTVSRKLATDDSDLFLSSLLQVLRLVWFNWRWFEGEWSLWNLHVQTCFFVILYYGTFL